MELMSDNYATLTPAYGRDYKSGKEAEAALRAGNDFVLVQRGGRSTLINVEQIKPGTTVNLRYKRLTAVKPVKV